MKPELFTTQTTRPPFFIPSSRFSFLSNVQTKASFQLWLPALQSIPSLRRTALWHRTQGVCSHSCFLRPLVSFYIPQELTFIGISHSKFNSQDFFFFFLQRKNLFQGTLTTNAGLTFPCSSPNPSSIFSSIAGCILENRVKASSKSEGQRVKVWLRRDQPGHWAQRRRVRLSECGGCGGFAISAGSPELCYRNFRFYRLTCRHVLNVVWRWTLWGTFTAQVFHLSHWFKQQKLGSPQRGEFINSAATIPRSVSSLQL